MNGYYIVDHTNTAIKVSVADPAIVRRKAQRRVLRDWVITLLFILGFLTLMAVGGTLDAWASAPVTSDVTAEFN